MTHDRQLELDRGNLDGGGAAARAPGKQTLTQGMGPSIDHLAARVSIMLRRRAADGAAVAPGAEQAVAGATGSSGAFGAGKYQPDDPFGLHLIAHEVAHTVQQSGGPARAQCKLEVSGPGDACEVEADHAADAMVRGLPAQIAGTGAGVQRAPDPTATTPTTPTATPTATPAVTADQVVVTNNGTGVSAGAITVLKEIVASVGETKATITSGKRTPTEQAAAMYVNLEGTSVEAQKLLYGPSGDKVIDVYVASKAAKKDAAAIQADMVAKINELGPTNVSNHCSNNDVIDVAPSSITNDDLFQTKAQAHAKVTKYLGPKTTPSDPAHHLEITP